MAGLSGFFEPIRSKAVSNSGWADPSGRFVQTATYLEGNGGDPQLIAVSNLIWPK